MCEDFLVGGTEKGLVTEITRGKESVVQTAAMADVVPAAALASARSDVLGASIGFGLFDMGQNIGKCLFMQVSVGVLQQVVVAEASARHYVARRGDGKEVVLTILRKHATCRHACGNIAGYLNKI